MVGRDRRSVVERRRSLGWDGDRREGGNHSWGLYTLRDGSAQEGGSGHRKISQHQTAARGLFAQAR